MSFIPDCVNCIDHLQAGMFVLLPYHHQATSTRRCPFVNRGGVIIVPSAQTMINYQGDKKVSDDALREAAGTIYSPDSKDSLDGRDFCEASKVVASFLNYSSDLTKSVKSKTGQL